MNSKLKALIELLVISLIFIVLTYFVQTNLNFFKNLIGKNIYGILIYLLIIIIAIVIAPISSIPLIPLVSNIWGWKLAAAISIIGWTLGSIIAFLLARKYGVKIVKRLIPLKQIYFIESKIPEGNLFFAVIFLRMIIPVDILSYALGLFTKIKFWPYALATFIGVIPVTLILAYVGTINPLFQLIVFLIVGIIILIGLFINKKVKNKSK
jgi:uncharacterized membrane protein YdjX (TVP38/TMEM64 family)